MIQFSLPWPPSVNLASTMPGLYRIEDGLSGRFYIGSAANLRNRWRQHLYRLKKGNHANPILQSVWNSGQDRLQFSVVAELPHLSSKERLLEEQKLLDKASVGYNRLCMNVLPIAGSPAGVKKSAAAKRRMALAATGRKHSAESKVKMRAAKLGRRLSLDHRAKIGAAGIGRPGPKHSPSQIEKWRKYSASQVRELKILVGCGSPVLTVAKALGMSRATARRILAGDSYVG